MATVSIELPAPIAQALGLLVAQVAQLGLAPVKCEVSSSFGNFAVSFSGAGKDFMLARDRGQFIVSGPTQAQLEAAGLWRAFVGVKDLAPPLLAWLASASAA
jgi:hypothetical protein